MFKGINVNVPKALCGFAMGVAALLAVIFLIDLIGGIFFGRFSITTDVAVVVCCGLLIWQGLETWSDL